MRKDTRRRLGTSPRRLASRRRRTLPVRARALAATVALTLTLTGMMATAGQAAEPGVNLGGDFFSSAPTYTAVASTGVHYVRMFAYWSTLEPARGRYDEGTLAAYDAALASLPPGTKAVLVVVGTPSWANGSTDIRNPPRDAGDFGRFMGYMAGRFAGRVTAWEIWNEENGNGFFNGDAAAYTLLLRAAYSPIKAADPATTVILGGMVSNDFHFLERVYAAGGKGSFDAVADHTDTGCNLNSPYFYLRDTLTDSRIDQFAFLGYREVHKVMLDHGDDKPLWLTEIGWNTSTKLCDGGYWAGKKDAGISEQAQAQYLSQAYHCLAQDPYVKVALWFELQDFAPRDTSQTRYGLLRSDFSAKPAFAALADYAHHGDRLTEPCGNFTGPKLTLSAPRNGASYEGPLHIAVSATSDAGVTRITLLYDGTRIRNFTDRDHPTTLAGEMTWQHAKHLAPGKHTITAIALDSQSNQTTQSVTVFHGSATGSRGTRRVRRARSVPRRAPHGARRARRA